MANVKTASAVKKFDTSTDKATKALIAAAKSLSTVVENLSSQVQETSVLTEEIQMKQATMDSLDESLEVALRKNKVETDLRISENEQVVLKELLKKHRKADVSSEEYESLVSEVASLRNDMDTRIGQAITAEAQKHVAKSAAAESELIANHRVDTAALKADMEALKFRNEYLVNQLDDYKTMLDEERKARVSVAESSARAAAANRSSASGSSN